LALWWLALYHRPSHYIVGSSIAAVVMLLSLATVKEPAAVWFDGIERMGLAIAFGFVVLYFVAKLREQHDQLAHMSITDPVTGAANIRTWDITMRTQMRWSRRNHEPFTVAIIHIGDLVEINNRHGFAAGDSLLAACTAAWIPELRESDTLFRLYGSDFTVVLPGADAGVARVLLDRLRQVSPDLTCSIGIATWDRSEKMAQLLHRARSAAEEAGENGGDCVVVDSPSLDIVPDDDDAHLTVEDGII
jgi:diguanylate cyclase (GGDEF)-like protein